VSPPPDVVFIDSRFLRSARDALAVADGRGPRLAPEQMVRSLHALVRAPGGITVRWYEGRWPNPSDELDPRTRRALARRRTRQRAWFAALRAAGIDTFGPVRGRRPPMLQGPVREAVAQHLEGLVANPARELELIDGALAAGQLLDLDMDDRPTMTLALDLYHHAVRGTADRLLVLADDPELVHAVRLARGAGPEVDLLVPEGYERGLRPAGAAPVPWALRQAARDELVISDAQFRSWFDAADA
jgi:hypothetical protein